MKKIVLPALSLVLLAAMPATAQSPVHSYLQIAQDNPDHPHRGGVQPSPAVVPAGSVDNSSTGRDRTTGTGQAGGTHSTGDAGHGGAATGGGVTAGDHGTGSTGGGAHGGAGGPPATSTPTIIGGQGTRPVGGAGHGGAGSGGAVVTGGGQTGGAGSTGGHNPGGTGTGGIDRTGGGILLPGTPAGGHGAGGAATGGDHGRATVFGTRPPNWSNYPRTFDRGTYQRNRSATRRFHWQSYNQPSGYYYRRWVFGQIFPRIFWAQDYWLTDYWMFDLPVPPYGYVWVRYGDDALLIDKRTGVVLQVVYGLFD